MDLRTKGATASRSSHRNGRPARASELTTDTRYRLLLEISNRIRGTLDLDQILNHLLDSLAEHVAYDAAGIFVLRGSLVHSRVASLGDLIAGVTWRGFTARSPQTDPMLREGKGIVGHVIRTGQPIVSPDVRHDPHYIEGRTGTRSEIAVPIMRDQSTIGALNLESDRLDAFGDHSLEVLRFFADAAAIAVEKAMLHEQLLEAQRVDEQLRLAQEVQARLLPAAPPRVPGYALAGLCIPSSRVGGDYFDFIPLPNGDVGLAVADVSGHGIPAALLMSALRALLRTHVRSGASLVQVAKTLNRQIPDSMAGAAFVTAFVAVLSPEEGRVTYVNCGHNAPLLVRADGAVESLDVGGPLLGVMEDPRFEVGEAHLGPGDMLALYTDGIVEVADRDGRWFDVDGLTRVVSQLRRIGPAGIVEQVLRAAREFSGTVDFEDDVTLMIVGREPRAA